MNILNGNALVTGAGSGIGRQLSLAYVRAGIQGITLADLNKDALSETARLIQAQYPDVKVLPIVVDVTDEKSVNAMVDQAVQTFGTLDCAANAAGVIVKSREKSAHVPSSEFDRVMNINTRAVALCMQAEARAMLKQPRKLTNLKALKGGNEQDPAFANPLGRLCYPDEIADAVVFLSSTMSSYVNGIGLVSDGGRSVQF
ncbi:dehydrogenase [Fusarium fujikuroi]|nr:dehydrogenase [Fusarium fujikuroi]